MRVESPRANSGAGRLLPSTRLSDRPHAILDPWGQPEQLLQATFERILAAGERVAERVGESDR